MKVVHQYLLLQEKTLQQQVDSLGKDLVRLRQEKELSVSSERSLQTNSEEQRRLATEARL